MDLIDADHLGKRKSIHIRTPCEGVDGIGVRDIAPPGYLSCLEGWRPKVFDDHEICHVRIMLLAFYETELFGLEMTADRIRAFSSALPELDDHCTSVLQDRMIKRADIWNPGIQFSDYRPDNTLAYKPCLQ